MEKLGTFILVCEVMHSLIQILAAKIGAVVLVKEGMHSLDQIFAGKARNLYIRSSPFNRSVLTSECASKLSIV